MDNISIKVHPPWYARGTPVINPRDGPAMALSDKPLFANPITIGCRGPSARGEPGEGQGRGRGQGEGGSQNPDSYRGAVGSWNHDSYRGEVGRQKTEVGRWNPDSYQSEDRSSGKPKGKTRCWLTLKTTFFITQNSVYSQWYAVLGRKCVNACPSGQAGGNACPNELVQTGYNA